MSIKLQDIVKHFEDGLSLADYTKIGRLIRLFGPVSRIVISGDPLKLSAELSQFERNNTGRKTIQPW